MIKRILTGRSQEEMIGFVLIVVMVIVVAVILIGLTLKKAPPNNNSMDIENFLEASILTTTECAINFAPQYDNMQDLIKSCYENQNCQNGESACKILNSSFSGMINAAFPIKTGSQYKAYYLIINYATNDSRGEEILSLGEANCSETGAMKIIPVYPGEVTVEMNLCYSGS